MCKSISTVGAGEKKQYLFCRDSLQLLFLIDHWLISDKRLPKQSPTVLKLQILHICTQIDNVEKYLDCRSRRKEAVSLLP
jgi:hypothetical protein